MKGLLIVVALCAVGVVQAQDYQDYSDYWDTEDTDDYSEWHEEEAQKLGIKSSEVKDLVQEADRQENNEDTPVDVNKLEILNTSDLVSDEEDDENDKRVEDDIAETFQSLEDKEQDRVDDYLIEDNRSVSKEDSAVSGDVVVDELDAFNESESNFNDFDQTEEFEKSDAVPVNDDKKSVDVTGEFWGDLIDDNPEEKIKEVKPDNNLQDDFINIMEETNKLLKEADSKEPEQAANQNSDDKSANDIEDLILHQNKDIFGDTQALLDNDKEEDQFEDGSLDDDSWVDLNDIIDETNKLLAEASLISKEIKDNGEVKLKGAQSIEDHEQDEENNDNFVPDELTNDEEELSSSSDTKINNDRQKTEEKADNNDDDDEEDTVGKVYSDLDEDLRKLFETWDKLSKDDFEDNNDEVLTAEDVLAYENKNGKPFREDVVLSQRDDSEDSVFSQIFDNKPENTDEASPLNENVDTSDDDSSEDEYEDILLNAVALHVLNEKEVALPYGNDNLSPLDPIDDLSRNYNMESATESDNSQDIEDAELDNLNVAGPVAAQVQSKSAAKVDENNLTSGEYAQLMDKFKKEHKQDLEQHLEEEFDEGEEGPKIVKLLPHEPVTLESPGFPGSYSRGQNLEWKIEAIGMGIDMVVHFFNVNGNMGDYLLVIPGGVDDSKKDGLVFSYRLNSERRYAFGDVDKMFIKFVAPAGGMPMMGSGFNFTLDVMGPGPNDEPDGPNAPHEPKPEPVLPELPATLTVNLGGIRHEEFVHVEDQFRELVADMAIMYINANNIDPGMNTTHATTQIRSSHICNIAWPGYENCTLVRFGVPLVYEDEESNRLNENDLRAMWYTYIYQDPFALRLRRMGIAEFAIPDEGRVLMVWLVIATGVAISAAMLGVALWKLSLPGYKKMELSDTDSLTEEKRGPDMFPTPHQNLPPMYMENEWGDDGAFDNSTRVDMGGYANQSYAPDLIDSDEDDIVVPRDRNSNVNRRNNDVV